VGPCEPHEVQHSQVQGAAHGSGQSQAQIQASREWTENSPVDKDLGVLVHEKLDISHQCALAAQKANCILGCTKRSMASRAREGILPLYSGDSPPGVLCPALETPAQERHGPVGVGPEEVTKMIRELEHLSCEDRLRELGLFSLEEEKAAGTPYCGLSVPEGAYKRAGEGLCRRACSDRTMGNSCRLKEGRFRPDRKKKFFTLMVVRQWNRLPAGAMETPSLVAFKARLDGALSNLV